MYELCKMKSLTRMILFTACLLMLPALSTHANEGSGTIQLRVLSLVQNLGQEYYFFDGSDYHAPRFSHHRPSRTTLDSVITAEGMLPVFIQQDVAGELSHQLVFQLALPKGAKQVLVIAAKTGNQVSMVALADNLSTNYRDWMLINSTATPLVFQFGEGKTLIQVPPGQSVPIQIEADFGTGAAVRIAAFREEGWELIYSTFWPVYEGQRGLIIFMQDGENIRLRNFFEPVN